jgi:hypothetical protein
MLLRQADARNQQGRADQAGQQESTLNSHAVHCLPVERSAPAPRDQP